MYSLGGFSSRTSFCRVLPLILFIPHIHTLSHQDTAQIIAIQSRFWFFFKSLPRTSAGARKLWPPRGGCWRVVNCSLSQDTSGYSPRAEAQMHAANCYLYSAFLFAPWNRACLFPLRYPVSKETSQAGWPRKRTIHWTGEKVGVLFPKSRGDGGCSSKQKYLPESLTGNVMWQHSCSNTFSSLTFFFFSFTLNGILDIF